MFAIERSTQRGPNGGKPRGYCLAWRGRGFPPHGRGQRSGWYLHKADAIQAAAVANAAVARDAARPCRPPLRLGDGAYLLRLTDPAGAVHWYGRHGETPDGEEATRFTSANAAGAAMSQAMGHGPAFWESERASRERTRQKMRGWRAEVVPDSALTPTPV